MSFIEYLKATELEARFAIARHGLFWVVKIKASDVIVNVGRYSCRKSALYAMQSLETAFRDGLFVGRKLQQYDDCGEITQDLSEKVSNA